MNRVLLVEDDDDVRLVLRMVLEDEGYDVDEAADGEAALEAFGRAEPDLVLVDLRLPGMHGFDVCRSLRARSSVPIIIVTAQSDTYDLVAGLEAGADDYVTKPVVPKELAARMRALLRRAYGTGTLNAVSDSPRWVFGPLEVRPAEAEVRRDGELVHLTKTELRLLCELAEHAGIVLSREQLLERIWGYDYLGDSRLVDAHIRRLRAKVERDPNEPEIVVTVRGLGYKLVAP